MISTLKKIQHSITVILNILNEEFQPLKAIKVLISILLILIPVLNPGPIPVFGQGISLKKLSVDLKSKKLAGGKVVTYDAQLFYKANGDLVSYFKPPLDYIIVNNRKGEIKVYHPKTNTVYTSSDPFLGSNSSYLYCFLNYRTADMNLRDYQFTLKSSKTEKGHQISYWMPSKYAAGRLSEIQLVHFNRKIVYIAYYDNAGNIFKKTYYGKTTSVRGIDFPETVTEITYTNKMRTDSVIDKSYYSNFLVDEACNSPYFDYKIPTSAKQGK